MPINLGDKLYIVVRDDLLPGQKIAQVSHAVTEFIINNFECAKEWNTKSNYICVLECSLSKLSVLLDKAKTTGMLYGEFFESDMNDELTSVAFEPSEKSKKLLSNLPLALKESK